ncbi:MAG: diguanylate cyclase [Desulfarculaceae bacterium]|nr:diguanylate cyclase [Desulfarculaceae bacterium]
MIRQARRPLTRTSPTVYFLKLFIPLFILMVGTAIVVGLLLQERHVREIRHNQVEHVRLEREVLQTDIQAHISDAVYLADLTSLALANPGAAMTPEQVLERAFYYFSREQSVYDQVRFLDAQGKERVRINKSLKGPLVVPPDKLQDKKDRYYFSDGIKQEPGQVYISPFDLNVEHHQIERPLKPTLRFASPVRSPQGGKAGLVVLNFLGYPLLERLRRAGKAGGGDMYLVNREGWWLVGPSPDKEWGFQIVSRSAQNMSRVFPKAWEDIASHPEGQVFTPNGLFTFQMVRVLNQAGELGSALPQGKLDDLWWVVSRVPSKALILPWRATQIGLVLGGLALMAALVWFWALSRSRRARAEMEVQEQQQRLEAVSNTAQDAIAMIDSQDKVQFWNRAAESLFGYSREEVMGQELHHLVSTPEVRAMAHKGMELFAQSGQGAVLSGLREVMARRKDGTSFPAEIAVSAFQMHGQWFAGGSVRDISNRKNYERELKRLANTDALTGVFSRRRFLELSGQEIARSRRYGGPLSLLMLDLDHFKAVNDTHGHEVGDLVLQSFVKACQAVLREVDIFGRVGGEEFMVTLPETSAEGALKAGERLRASVEETVVRAGGKEIRFTVSIGAAVWREGLDLETLMGRADEALYRAKEGGRNRVALAEENKS